MQGGSKLWVAVLLGLLLPPAGAVQGACESAVRDFIPPVVLPMIALQGIALDAVDGTLWICSGSGFTVLHVGRDLRVLGSFEAPFADLAVHEVGAVGGIAYNPNSDTLFLSQPARREVWEVETDGSPTGLVIPLDFQPPPNGVPPFAKGLAFQPSGDGEGGSLWVVESVLSAVYRLSLDGTVLDWFCVPDDPDGCPGEGRAARANDVGLLPGNGGPDVLELTGGVQYRDQLHRVTLDGEFTGLTLPLADLGGPMGGFVRGTALHPATGEERPVLFVTVESSSELHAVEISLPEILPIADVECLTVGGTVTVQWKNFDSADRIDILRDGAPLATQSGNATSFNDVAPPDGIHQYEVVAVLGSCESRGACTAVTGAGQVLRHVPFDGQQGVDIAEDASENLWITDSKNQLFVYGKDLALVATFPSPFQGADDETTGIAYNPVLDTLFVYNADTNEVVEIDVGGEILSAPFPSGVPNPPDDEAVVTSMLFDPAGAGGAGSFWYLDPVGGVIQQRNRQGQLLGSCVHPDHAADPPPAGGFITAKIWGLSAFPGSAFQIFEVSGGKARDLGATRILRIDAHDCQPTGEEMTTVGVAAVAGASYLSVHRTLHDGKPVLYVLDPASFRSRIFEVEVRPPPVQHLTDLECQQPFQERNVHLGFSNPGNLDAVEIRRDGLLVATLSGVATSFEDADVPSGLHTYAVAGRRGVVRSDDRECAILVGAGSVAAREFSSAITSIHQVALDPVDGTYLVASISNRFSDFIYRFDASFRLSESLVSPFPRPLQIAALAVRDAGGSSEIYCLGWNPGASGLPLVFPVDVLDATGALVRHLDIAPPPIFGDLISFPSGMVWDAATDTFWYLERNANVVVNISVDGTTLGMFDDPAPIHQDQVINFGIAIDPVRNALYLASAGRLDHEVTKIVEMTRGGVLTGVEIPVGALYYDSLRGFALNAAGTGLVVSSSRGGVSDFVTYRAFDDVALPRNVSCTLDAGGVDLAWQNGEVYDTISIYRDQELAPLVVGTRFYRVVAHKGALTSGGTLCDVPATFIRGDADVRGDRDLTDAIVILLYLFQGGTVPPCLDAADVDDTGDLDLTDAIYLLSYLFIGGREPPSPTHEHGPDPTADELSCLRAGS
jgi:hypothetical protein